MCVEGYSIVGTPVVDGRLAVAKVVVDVVVGSVGGGCFEGGKVVCKFCFVEVKVCYSGFDVFKENVPE